MANGKSNSVALPVPIFTGEKYHFWSIKMKTYFLSQNLWKIVNEGPENTSTLSEFELQQQQQNDAAALFILQQALDDYIFSRISEAKTAKEAWQILKAEFQGNSETLPLPEQDMKNCKKYLPLYNAILEGDLLSVQQLCDEDKDALEARITVNWDTALHVAVGTANANHIVEYLVNKMSMDQVSLKNKEGNTVLSVAAMAGNLQAANMIMRKDEHQSLIEVENNSDGIPLIEAARHGQKKMTEYLMQFSKSYLEYATATRFEDNSGGYLLSLLIIAGFYDLALELLRRHKRLGIYVGESLLTEITRKPSVFPSGRRRNIKLRQYVNVSKVTSYIKETREAKLMHDNVLQIVKYLCNEIKLNLDYEKTFFIFKKSFLLAAELGVCEIVKEIIKSFPDAIWFTNEKKHNIFHLTIINRREKVFNLIFKISSHKHLLLMSRDVYGNNVLHLAGLLAPENQLNLIPGAALQMQHELQWFKEIENIVQPAYKVDKNCNGETPAMIFTKAHRELVKEGRDWMKVVANSCSVAAALIATIVFAAAITVPGDYNDAGRPNFYRQIAFTIFSVSDAVSFFSSIAAIIMFLSILTARYAEDDFLYVLPKRLIWGLVMLFLSLTCLMVAFCATFYLVFCDRKAYWILALMFGSALLPLSLFASSQYPLLWDLMVSTYGPGIVCKERTFYEIIKEKKLKLVSYFV